MGKSLSGMKAICEYFDRSAPTILKLIREEGFPAQKIRGEWESDTELVDKWRLGKITREAARDAA